MVDPGHMNRSIAGGTTRPDRADRERVPAISVVLAPEPGVNSTRGHRLTMVGATGIEPVTPTMST